MKPDWLISPGLIPYPQALNAMERRVDAIIKGDKPELVWCLEHPALITAGTSANPKDLLNKNKFPVFDAGRGGQYTYHGPGQRVCYLMLNLKERGVADLRKYVSELEQLVINSLKHFGIEGERREGRIGIWVNMGKSECKIAAIGIRIRRWITFHGLSINVNPNLEDYSAIIPCGISQYGVTSMHDLGVKATMADLDKALKTEFFNLFN